MPNPVRCTYQFYNSFIPQMTALYATVTIGASGAPTLVALQSMGIDSITRLDEGEYRVVLNKKYQRLIFASASYIAANGAAAPDLAVSDNDVLSSGQLTILTQNGGVNTDPASGETMLLKIELKDSSVAAG